MDKETFDRISMILASDDRVSVTEYWKLRNSMIANSSPDIKDYQN